MPATEQPTLVGIDDMTFPKLADIDRRVAEAGLWQTFRALPAGVRVVLHLAWQTAPPRARLPPPTPSGSP